MCLLHPFRPFPTNSNPNVTNTLVGIRAATLAGALTLNHPWSRATYQPGLLASGFYVRKKQTSLFIEPLSLFWSPFVITAQSYPKQ